MQPMDNVLEWCTATLKEYENLVHYNLADILHIFFLSNNK